MKYSDRQLAGLSARPPDRVELIDAGSLGYGTGPSCQLRLRADKLPSPNHCESLGDNGVLWVSSAQL